MTSNARQLVDAHLANSQPDPDARPVTPEPTTQSGVAPEHALYDTPPDGSQSAEFRTGRRKRRSTERGGRWIEDFNRAEQRRTKTNRSRKVNGARRAHEQESQNPRDDGSPEPTLALPEPESTRAQLDAGPLPVPRGRGRSRRVRDISRSPTPGSTDHELEETAQPPTGDSQRTYVYEALDHKGLVQHAKEKFGLDVRGCNTQTILTKLRVAEMQQTSQVGPPRLPPSVNTLPAVPLQVGGGWHLDSAASQRGQKRGSQGSAASSGSSKRQRVGEVLVEDTPTESETDDERLLARDRRAVQQVLFASGLGEQALNSARRFVPGTQPPPPSPNIPSRGSTPTTIPETQYLRSVGGNAQSQCGKSFTPTSPVPPIPTLLSPARDPAHERLRRKALVNYIQRTDRDARAAAKQDAEASARNEEVDELAPSDDEVVPETDSEQVTESRHGLPQDASTGPFAPSEAPLRTYRRNRTHLPSQSNNAPPPATEAERDDDDDEEPVIRPNSPSLTREQLVRRERTRALAAKAMAELQEQTRLPLRQRLFVQATSAPITRPQPRPTPGAGPSRLPPGAGGESSGARLRETRRADPVGSARADMIEFNEACARNEATSFVQSALRESERTAPRVAPTSRPLHELLDDDEEALARAEAFAKKKWPHTSSSRGRVRKPKPLARDVSGLDRQILIVAKLHFFVYALVQGVYQTRATFLRWAASVYYATWHMELPTTPYVPPPHEHLEIMVNSIATMRGKVKERVRPFTANVAGFQQRQTNQDIIQENLRRFNLLYPNNFHCKTYCPRTGHYENPEIAHCIAVALFHGPGSVGVMYPDYFTDLPLTVVAFALAIWQFCIEEWSNGWHQNGDLGMAAMREKYEAQLAGLKELRDVAPKRMDRLQTQWRDYVMEYSGAQLTHAEDRAAGLGQSEMRADTPDLELEDEAWVQVEAQAQAQAQAEANDAISVEEMEKRLFETARQASLQERAREIAAREEMETEDRPDSPVDAESRAPTPHSRTPSPPPPELNSQGRLTARSKGKARSN